MIPSQPAIAPAREAPRHSWENPLFIRASIALSTDLLEIGRVKAAERHRSFSAQLSLWIEEKLAEIAAAARVPEEPDQERPPHILS